MILTELSTLIANIPDINADITAKLKDNLIMAYQLSVKKELRNILNSQDKDEQKYSVLESFLEFNWGVIKGSLLAYTSIHDTKTTKVLCKVAELICEFKNSKLDSKSLLFTPLQFLMPGVELIPLISSYDNLYVNNIPLEVILKTFVLNEDSSSLIPVSVILENLNLRPYDFLCVVFDKEIRNSTNQRIISHSGETLAIYSIMNRLSIVESDKNHFLGNLMELCRQLKFNDSHSGIGKEDNAGKGAYPAIIAFKEYYDVLEGEEKKKLPEGLEEEINTLLELSGNPAKNQNTTATMATCIGTRREALEAFISSPEQKQSLAKIAASKESKDNLIKNLHAELQLAKEALQDSLNNVDSYHGADSLGILIKLLEKFKVDFKIQDINELIYAVKDLTADEILSLCEKDENLEQFIGPIKSNIENFTSFVLNCSEDNLIALLKVISTKGRITELFDSAKTLGMVINFVSNNEKTKTILEASKNNIIKSGEDFGCVLQYLNETQITTVCIALKDHLKNIIVSIDDFGCVLKYLNETKITAACISLKDIITSGEDFCYFLQFLDENQIRAVYAAFKDNLKDIIKSGFDFGYALNYLTKTQRGEVYTAFQDNFKNILKSEGDFGYVLKYLTETQRDAVYIAFKDNLKDIITSGLDFSCALYYLTETQKTEVYTVFKDNFKNIIKSGIDFSYALQPLNETQKTEVYTVFKDNLKDIIKSGKDLGYFIKYLNEDQKTEVCTELTDSLKDIIKSEDELDCALQYLNETQKNVVNNALKETPKDDNDSGGKGLKLKRR